MGQRHVRNSVGTGTARAIRSGGGRPTRRLMPGSAAVSTSPDSAIINCSILWLGCRDDRIRRQRRDCDIDGFEIGQAVEMLPARSCVEGSKETSRFGRNHHVFVVVRRDGDRQGAASLLDPGRCDRHWRRRTADQERGQANQANEPCRDLESPHGGIQPKADYPVKAKTCRAWRALLLRRVDNKYVALALGGVIEGDSLSIGRPFG